MHTLIAIVCTLKKVSYSSISFETERSLIFKELMFSILEIVQYPLLTSFLAKTPKTWIGDKAVKFFCCTLNFFLRTPAASSLEISLPNTALTMTEFVFNGHQSSVHAFLSTDAFEVSCSSLESFKMSVSCLVLRSSCSPLLFEDTDLLSHFWSSHSSGSLGSWS